MKFIRIILLCAGITASLNVCRARPVEPPPLTPTDDVAGTLAYHLATNAVGHAQGHTDFYADTMQVSNWIYASYTKSNLACLTNSVWSTHFWLRGVKGLSATSIGFKDGLAGQGMVTMVSPRHYLCASHMHPEGYSMAFLDTNNVIRWRKSLGRADLSNDISVGILSEDLPPSVGYQPVLPTNFSNYIPANMKTAIQGIGMNQDMRVFGEPMNFGNPTFVLWSTSVIVPFGLGTNWNIAVRGGDSSNPAMLLINDQLVLVSHNYFTSGGPNYALNFDAINQAMHQLSTHNHLRSDYQLTPISLANWKVIAH